MQFHDQDPGVQYPRLIADHSTLGFKYIGNTALQLVEQGYEVPFAYEEAIGFMIGSAIRDKDGVAASVRNSTYLGRKTKIRVVISFLFQRFVSPN